MLTGKLEEKSFGKYIDKAEGYLHKYESSHSTSTAGPTTKPTGHSSDEHNSSKPQYSSQHYSSAPHGSDKKKKKEEEEKSEGELVITLSWPRASWGNKVGPTPVEVTLTGAVGSAVMSSLLRGL